MSAGERAVKEAKAQAIAGGQSLAVTARSQATPRILRAAGDAAERRKIVAADSKFRVDESVRDFSRAVERLVQERGAVAQLVIPQASPACVAALKSADQIAQGALRMANSIKKSWGEQESEGIWKFYKQQKADADYYRKQEAQLSKP